MNAPAQPVQPVSNPATFFASRVLPDQIAEALIEAREKCGVQKRKDEDGHAYFDAVDVVPEVGKVFREVGLTLIAPNFQIRSVGTWLVLQRAGCLRHDKGAQFPITAEWLLDVRDLPPGPAMNAALTQSTSGLYRVCMDLVKDETKAKRDPALTSDEPRSKPAGKTPKARHIGALARANGQTVAEDVSEKEQREQAEELARVEAEKKADADPRFAGEAPLPDPPGLMEDEPTIPPAPAQEFAMKPAGGQWVVYEAESVTVSRPGGDVSVTLPTPGSVSAKAGAEPREVLIVDAAKQNAEVDAYLAAKFQPAPGNSSTSEEGGCKTAPESTPVAIASIAGDSSSGPVKSESSAGGESLPPSSSSPPAPRPSDELVQPSPEVVALVGEKASQVLSKRSAEGRAAKWAGAKTREARKEFWCAECQPESGPRLNKDGQRLPAIQPKDQHKDSGNGPRCCWACWERLESEAAGKSAGAA